MSLKLNERYPARFNNPTAGYPQGSFKNRTTPTAKDGSYLEKDWANDKEGFFQSLLSAAGVTANGSVDAVGASQFFDSLLQLAQAQTAQAFTTAGTSTALTLAPVPAITAYSANQRFSVKFSVSSGLNPTLNISSKGAKSIKQYSSTGAKVAASFSANQIGDVVYDGTDFVLLNPVVSINKTTSPIDTTAGLVTVTGDAGWLADGTPTVAVVTNADAWTASGSWRTGPTWTGSPYAGSQGRNQGTLLHQCGFSDATYASQLFLGISSDNLWFRRKTANVWAAPVELWHTGNLAAKAQCTAWVNFNGSGTVTTRDSYNVSSITDNGVGDYTVNFATAMANANYVPTISVQAPTSGAVTRTGVIYATSPTSANGLGTTAARILVGNTSGTTNLEDNATVAFSVIGGV